MRDELNDLHRHAAWDAANKAPVWRDPVRPTAIEAEVKALRGGAA